MHGTKLYVGNLSYSVVDRDVFDLFSHYGKVKYVNIFDGEGFGFVEMSNQLEAKEAKEALNNLEFAGRYLKVNEARHRHDRPKQSY
ncbi:MAG: RNA recognition motif domain-containing protein [bacterium]